MSRRVVMRLTEFSGTVKDAADFFDYVKELGCGPRSRFQYQVDKDGHACLVVELPEGAAKVLERKQAPPVRTRTQQAVHDRLATRKAAVAAGEPVLGHEEPIKRLKRRKK